MSVTLGDMSCMFDPLRYVLWLSSFQQSSDDSCIAADQWPSSAVSSSAVADFFITSIVFVITVFAFLSPLVTRYRRSTLGRRAFSVGGPTVWNSLPVELRKPTVSKGVFRRTLRTILFAGY